MQVFEWESNLCCTAVYFKLVSARDYHDDDQRFFFWLGATMFEELRRAQRNVRGRYATVTLCFRSIVPYVFSGGISANRNRKHARKGIFLLLFSIKTYNWHNWTFRNFIYFNLRNSLWEGSSRFSPFNLVLNSLQCLRAHIRNSCVSLLSQRCIVLWIK